MPASSSVHKASILARRSRSLPEAASPHLGQLKRLHLKHNPIKGEGIVALFESPTLDNLAIFHINDGWSCRKREGWRYKPRSAP